MLNFKILIFDILMKPKNNTIKKYMALLQKVIIALDQLLHEALMPL
jgi:hypothetical protein